MAQTKHSVTAPTQLIVDTERLIVLGDKHALIASKSVPDEWHAVSYDFNDNTGQDEWMCSCRGFEIRHKCRHVRVVDRWNAGKASVRLASDEESLT